MDSAICVCPRNIANSKASFNFELSHFSNNACTTLSTQILNDNYIK